MSINFDRVKEFTHNDALLRIWNNALNSIESAQGGKPVDAKMMQANELALKAFSTAMRTYTASESNLNLSLSNAMKNDYNKKTLSDANIIPIDKKIK